MEKEPSEPNVFLLLSRASTGWNYKEKRTGPSTEPCGTPPLPLLHEEETCLCDQHVCGAALRSGGASRETSPLLEALRRSLLRRTSAGTSEVSCSSMGGHHHHLLKTFRQKGWVRRRPRKRVEESKYGLLGERKPGFTWFPSIKEE